MPGYWDGGAGVRKSWKRGRERKWNKEYIYFDMYKDDSGQKRREGVRREGGRRGRNRRKERGGEGKWRMYSSIRVE